MSKGSKAKILLAAHIGYPWGGVSQRYSDLVKSSLPQKIDLTFFETSPDKATFSSTGKFNLQNITAFVRVGRMFIAELNRTSPSIVHIASAYGWSFIKHSLLIVLSKLWRAKVILAPHCSISVFVPDSGFLRFWMKLMLNYCDGMIVLSSEWLAIKKIAPKPKVTLLKNSIDLGKYLDLERSINQENKDLRFIYLGHIGKEKGSIDLVHAVDLINRKGIRRFKVLIFGEEIYRGELENIQRLVKQLNLDDLFIFSDPVFDEAKIQAFRDAHVFLLPSHHEGLPISVIEAMAAGLPVIATNVGGLPDLIENSRNGSLVTPGCPQELADAMLHLIENDHLRYQYGMEGRKKARENHDLEKYVDRLIEFYEEISLCK